MYKWIRERVRYQEASKSWSKTTNPEATCTWSLYHNIFKTTKRMKAALDKQHKVVALKSTLTSTDKHNRSFTQHLNKEEGKPNHMLAEKSLCRSTDTIYKLSRHYCVGVHLCWLHRCKSEATQLLQNAAKSFLLEWHFHTQPQFPSRSYESLMFAP